jgi:hypothetical protein
MVLLMVDVGYRMLMFLHVFALAAEESPTDHSQWHSVAASHHAADT